MNDAADTKCLHCHISRTILDFNENVDEVSAFDILGALASVVGELLEGNEEAEQREAWNYFCDVVKERQQLMRERQDDVVDW